MLPPQLRNGKPHWETWVPQEQWIYYESFSDFLTLGWSFLNLPAPTEAQMEMAHYIQFGVDSTQSQDSLPTSGRKDIIRCFRSLGKSYISAMRCVWSLMRNPKDEKILVLSAAGQKAKEFVTQVKGVMEIIPISRWLLSGEREGGITRRDLADQFDVRGSSLSQVCSITAKSVTSQITGARATTALADDIEIRGNSRTQEAREVLLHLIRSDLLPIVETEHGTGDILMLGTPQSEESIYNTAVMEMGFNCLTIPARFPTADKLESYILQRNDRTKVNILAPYLLKKFEDGKIGHWETTDSRFSEENLAEKEAAGKTSFALQYMLDTSLSDAERYPLKTKDFITFNNNTMKAPVTISYGLQKDKSNILPIPNVGFSGDFFQSPMYVDSQWSPYERIVGFVDTAGQGADETACSVAGILNGMIFVLDVRGFRGDTTSSMVEVAKMCEKYKVNELVIEANYSGTIWKTAFLPILRKFRAENCAVTVSDWTNMQKEQRIIETLEPALTSHKMVMDKELAERESRMLDTKYSLIYQMTHLTNERGCLKHDDRLDSLAGLVSYLQKLLGVDVEEAVRVHREEIEQQEIDARWASFDGDVEPSGSYRIDFVTGQRHQVVRF